jgi:hypothetical protein
VLVRKLFGDGHRRRQSAHFLGFQPSYLVMVTDEDNRPTSWDFNQAAAMREIEINSNTVIDRQCAPLYVHLPSISTAFYSVRCKVSIPSAVLPSTRTFTFFHCFSTFYRGYPLPTVLLPFYPEYSAGPAYIYPTRGPN